MLNNIISWSPNGQILAYSSLTGNTRRIYLYDVMDEVSYPSQFQRDSLWYELDFIHSEQFIIHEWKKGFFIYDIVTKQTQFILEEENSNNFSFDKNEKHLLFNSTNKLMIFDAKNRTKKLLMDKCRELLIDKTHQTFITINNSSELNIYFKNEAIYTKSDAFGIYLTNDHQFLFYFQDSAEGTFTVNKLHLETLEVQFTKEIKGSLQNANLNKDILHINAIKGNQYDLYNLIIDENSLDLIKSIETDNQLFSSVSPTMNTIAIATDLDLDTSLNLLEID